MKLYKISDEKNSDAFESVRPSESSVCTARLLWRSGDAEVERNGFSPPYLSREIGFQLWNPRLKRILDLLEFVIRVATMSPSVHEKNFTKLSIFKFSWRLVKIFLIGTLNIYGISLSYLLPFDYRGP